MDQELTKPRLSPGQRVLAGVLGVLIVTVQVMIVQAYRHLGATTEAFVTATDVTEGFYRLQREALKLEIEVELAKPGEGLEKIELRRELLDQQLEVTAGAMPPGSAALAALDSTREPLGSFDAELAKVKKDPSPARLARSREVLRRDADAAETTLKEGYDATSVAFFGAVENELRARRSLERVLVQASGLSLAVGLVLAFSLRRKTTKAYAHSYNLLVEEVNERKTAERALRESEERFRALVHHASDVFTVVGADGMIRYQSPAVDQVLGYTASDLIGKELADLVDASDHAAFHSLLDNARRHEGAPVVGELSMRPRGDQSPRRFELTVTDLLDDPTVEGLVVNYRDITERARYQEQLTKQAFHDPLTGLPNRALFHDRLEHSLRQRAHTVALLFVDLDRFKVVNDSLGHDAGDELLRAVAERLAGCLRDGDTLARLGGDEFVVLLPEVADPSEAVVVAQRLESRLEPPFDLTGQSVFVSASVGIATGDGAHHSAEELLRDADAAMYEAKARGRARHALFDSAMHTRAVTRLEIETDLRLAIDAGKLELHYQPIKLLDSRQVVGLEALVRWNRADGSVVPPAEFIPVAEETGLVHPIGRWVLREACRQLADWRAELPQAAKLYMSVNVSARQLADANLSTEVATVLEETGLDPGSLVLELTESAVAHNLEAAAATLQTLKWMSVRLAMDDFGTGYSSLGGLSQLPLDILKIDQSFVARLDTDAHSRAIVYAIISLANALGIRVTGEGIETPAQLVALLDLGCQHGQGFLLGRPVPAAELGAVLRTIDVDAPEAGSRLSQPR